MKRRSAQRCCMGKVTGFLEYNRHAGRYRDVIERTRDFHPVEVRLTESEIMEQTARCMDCGIPFCHGCGCPLQNVIPEFNDLVYHGRWPEALEVLLATNNFPEFTGRICPAPCECSCVLGINKEPVTIRLVELAIIEQAFARGIAGPRPPAVRRNERVAVIGSGPAGLTVADTLNHAGFHVVVYDSATKAGGILRYGIPEFKLEKSVVDRRISLMEAEGVVFEMGVRVGDDISYRYLQSRYDAVCLCTGARQPRDLTVSGRELGGIHFAMDYLVQQNKKLGDEPVDEALEINAAGKHVVVIGGGDTGADCLGTALRQGAASVTQLEIMPKPPMERSTLTPWPMWPHILRLSSSHKEGGKRLWGLTAKEFIGKDGTVKEVRTIDVEWETPAEGRPAMREKTGSERLLPADLVLLAMGFCGPKPNRIISDLGIRTAPTGIVCRDGDNMTNVPGVFVSGDMSMGASLVVRAISDGRKAANGILRYCSSASHDLQGNR